MPEESAHLKRLRALLDSGKLKIITSEHACGAGKHPKFDGFNTAVCAAFKFPVTNPHHFVIHDVVKIEEGARSKYRAYSAEEFGDICIGLPEGLVKRLQQWATETKKGMPDKGEADEDES